MFRYHNHELINMLHANRLIDVSGGRDRDNNNVHIWKPNGSPAQKWDVVYVDEFDKYQGRGPKRPLNGGFKTDEQFYIVSSMNRNMVLSLRGNRFVLATKKGSAGQLFSYDAKNQSIVSAEDPSKAVSIKNRGKGRQVVAEAPNTQWWQQFTLMKDGHIKNKRNVHIDVAGSRARNNSPIITNRRNNRRSQRWVIEYVFNL